MVLGYAVVAAGTFVYVISTTRGESWAGFVVTLLGGLCIAALSSIAILRRFEEEDRAVSALLVSATSAVLIIPLLLIAAVFESSSNCPHEPSVRRLVLHMAERCGASVRRLPFLPSRGQSCSGCA